jgi:hypothetical protein
MNNRAANKQKTCIDQNNGDNSPEYPVVLIFFSEAGINNSRDTGRCKYQTDNHIDHKFILVRIVHKVVRIGFEKSVKIGKKAIC